MLVKGAHDDNMGFSQSLSRLQICNLQSLSHSRVDKFLMLYRSCTYSIYSSPPGAAYMCQLIESALVQIMACRLFGAKPLSKPMLDYRQLDPWDKIQWNFNQTTKISIHENASDNIVCEMAAILSWGRWVNIILSSVSVDIQVHAVAGLSEDTVMISL